jgi:hypothetical protein
MNKLYSSTVYFLFAIILTVFSSTTLKAQTTCTPIDPLVCATLVPIVNPFLGVQGNSTQQSILSKPILVTGTNGCLLVSFTQGGTATVSSTTVTILTSTGEVTCTNVPVTNGKVCIKICDPRITQGSTVSVRLHFAFSPNSVPLGTVIVNDFAVVSTPDIVLPLDLLDFKAAIVEGGVKLNWVTSDEVNVRHFEILRSGDGINFSKVNKVEAKGGSGKTNYELVDVVNINEKAFYRLNMVDLDGRAKLSQIVMIRLNGQNQPVIVIAPNPVQSLMKVKMSDFPAGAYNIELRNSIGQLQYAKAAQLNGNEHTEIIKRTRAMSKGLYIITISNQSNNSRNSMRVIID